MTDVPDAAVDEPTPPLFLDYWSSIPPEEDGRQLAAVTRVLHAARAGADAAIEDQVLAAYLISHLVRGLRDTRTPEQFGFHGLMWQATVPVALASLDVGLYLEEWADACEERWDMYRRVEAPPHHHLSDRYPADLLAGQRYATESEARQLAGEDAAHLRAMAAAHRECFEHTKRRLHLGHIRPPDEPLKVRTALYFWYDADDVLLYIGITGDLAVRQTSHAKRSSWSEFADHSKIQWLPSRAKAEAAEKVAIEAKRPLFNHVYNDTSEARARLVAYLVEKDRLDLLVPAVSRG